ncbi:MAG: S8 family serine peptidase [Bacteroidota bacterium]
MKDHQPVEQLQQQMNRFGGRSTQLKTLRCIDTHMDVWHLSFDHNSINENQFLEAIRRNPQVEFAQFNHLLELRSNIPNDPRFGLQWQYVNNGQDGGIVGADIDADLAWEVTTGGLTATGDTIVVCVIDEGYDAGHVDLQGNIWFNRAEIPNNNIDDDNNGFVDDYRGWYANSRDDNINVGGFHGTAVAGIVGARGDDGIGVTGVNWEVKLMLVGLTGASEANVLEAYSYPLAHRKRYNETNGAEGAFVVATNASWGRNRLWANQAPLWCAMYDTLGAYGILNCGATTNLEDNVDQVGDMPTSCASEFLISVTNMTRQDRKLNPAGFGATHVDLGAFGHQTYTIDNNGTYGPFGGTSGATPHVCGAVGLLYSVPVPAFMDIVKENPAEATQIIKRYIFEGVDHNESLEGITVTEGRLNLNNSVRNMLFDFDPCPIPISLTNSEVLDTSLSFTWVSSDSVLQSDLRYRILGDTVWNQLDSVSSPLIVNNLQGCTTYELQVRSSCDSLQSAYTTIDVFTTEGCCTAPETLQIDDLEEGLATTSWQGIFAGQSYNLQYRPIDSLEWTTVNISDTETPISGLDNCTRYEYRVESVCAIDSVSGYSPIQTFISFCPCDRPANVDTTIVGTSSFTLIWDGAVEAVSYDIRYRRLGAVNWTFVQSSTPSITVDNLESCQNYQFQIRSDCNVINSGYSGSQIIQTDCAVSTSELAAGVEALQVYPSPFWNELMLELDLEESMLINVELRSLSGQLVDQQQQQLAQGRHRMPIEVESDLPAGVYLLSIQTQEGRMVRKVLKQ